MKDARGFTTGRRIKKRDPRPAPRRRNEDKRRERMLEFYGAWKAHKDAGFEPSREECERLAKMHSVDAPPFADPTKEDLAQFIELLAPTPAGQEILRKIAALIPEPFESQEVKA